MIDQILIDNFYDEYQFSKSRTQQCLDKWGDYLICGILIIVV